MNHATATSAEQIAREAIRLLTALSPRPCDCRKYSLALRHLRQLHGLVAAEKSARRPRRSPARRLAFPTDLKKGA